MKRFVVIVFALALAWSSCSENTPEPEENQETRDSIINVSGFSQELSLGFPVEFARSNKPRARYNEMTGEIEITAGEGFHIICTEESLSISQLKEELETDLLFSYRYETENPNELVFVQVLPEGTELSYHFIQRLEFPGITIIARSDQSGEFTKQQVQTMMSVLANSKPSAS